MSMIRANPRKRRQLPLSGPMFFWRTAEDGASRVGLVVLPRICRSPDCPCRDVDLIVYRVDERLVGAGLRANGIAFYTPSAGPDGAAGCQTSCVLRADLDLDTGAIAIAEKAPPECRDEAALAWLREELDGEVLDHLARVSLRTKGVRPEARREVTGFRPNRMVGFAEAFVTGRVDAYILDGRRLDVVDVYCVEPACTCTEMRFVVAEDYDPLGSVAVDLDGARPPRYEGPPILTALWQALRRRYPDLDVFRGRAAKVKEAGRDILARAAQPGRPVPEVGRNQPCPCGSGKKYKRCCLGKISAHG